MEIHQASVIKLQKTIRGFIVRKKLIASFPSYSQSYWKNFRLVKYPQLITEYNKIIDNFAYDEKYSNSVLRTLNPIEKNSPELKIDLANSSEFKKVENYETIIYLPLEKPSLTPVTFFSVKLREKWINNTEELKEGKKKYVIHVDTGPEIKEFKGFIRTLTGCLKIEILSRKEFKVSRPKPLCEPFYEQAQVCVDKNEFVEIEAKFCENENKFKDSVEESPKNALRNKENQLFDEKNREGFDEDKEIEEEGKWNLKQGPKDTNKKEIKLAEEKRIAKDISIAQETNQKFKEKHEKSPERLNRTPEKLNKTPEILRKIQEKPEKSPERHKKSPERHKKSPERAQKTPIKDKKSIDPAELYEKLPKSEIASYKNPESRKSSIDSKKKSKKALKNLPVNLDSSSNSNSSSSKPSTKNFKIRVRQDPPYSSLGHNQEKTQKEAPQKSKFVKIQINSQDESKLNIVPLKKPKSKFFPYEKNSQVLPLIYSQKHGFSNYKDYGFISDLNSHRPRNKKKKDVQTRIWSCKSEQKFVAMEKKLPKFSPYNSKMIEKQYAEFFCLSKNDQMQNRKSGNFVVNERIKQLYGK